MKLIPLLACPLLLVMLLAPVEAADNATMIHGEVTDLSIGSFTWSPMNFAGFYYDPDKNIGNEQLTFTLTDIDPVDSIATLSDQEGARGIVYMTTAQNKNFKFKPWGSYMKIGFLAEPYFTAYNVVITPGMIAAGEDTTPYLYDKSKNRNLMTNEQISKVLIDSDEIVVITTGSPLKLKEGYELALKSIDPDGKVRLELSRNGSAVDSKIVMPSIYGATMGDKTYYFKKDLGDTREIVTIAVHFKQAFRVDTEIAVVDAIFQISDTPTPIRADQQYGKMSIRNVDPSAFRITMDNKDSQIILGKNMEIKLMNNIYIKTANQSEISSANPLRYYIYKKYTEPGTYQIRGSVTDLGVPSFTLTPMTFAGFYYDIDRNISTEQFTFSPIWVDAQKTTGTLSDQEARSDHEISRGILYKTTAMRNCFRFEDWGTYNLIVFLGKPFFAGYTDSKDGTASAILDYANNTNLLDFNYLTRILKDSNEKRVITLDSTVNLDNGYSLKPTIGNDKNGILVELLQDGGVIDRFALMPPDTYVYKTNIGNATGVPAIAVHFDEPIYIDGKGYCSIDGVWQISETPITIDPDLKWGNLTLDDVDIAESSISLSNKDFQVALSKNKTFWLTPDICIKTANQDATAADPLRYYIYKLQQIGVT